ncbi:DUF4124 domain-containing protein [Rhodanobacter sp. B04]|uniref:DUF4124 domain-containing protein n=1 Tax=Rhodanobacter sp. B04 TaxID=1945860 RepID=UPI0020C4A785|nr:DUF4124 domain-containing protein [Rhodanobacter sp. B04]
MLAGTTPAVAQTEIHRCVGADGHPLFTDQPCAALQATPVSPAAATSSLGNPSAAPPPVMCAANLGELRQSVIDAFASHDANRLAGLMLWGGYGRGAAIADIRSLGSLMKQPLLDISPADDPASDASSAQRPASTGSLADPFDPQPAVSAPASGSQLVLHTTGNDGSGAPREWRFDIVRRAGCLWLRNAD